MSLEIKLDSIFECKETRDCYWVNEIFIDTDSEVAIVLENTKGDSSENWIMFNSLTQLKESYKQLK